MDEMAIPIKHPSIFIADSTLLFVVYDTCMDTVQFPYNKVNIALHCTLHHSYKCKIQQIIMQK